MSDGCILPPVDLIVAVDSGGSMAAEWPDVEATMAALAQGIVTSGLDMRVVLIAGSDAPVLTSPPMPFCMPSPLGSGSCPGDSNEPTYRRVLTELGSNNALTIILQTYPLVADVLRVESRKLFFVISDDESAVSAQQFTSEVALLDPPADDYRFFALVCTMAWCPPFEGCASDGLTYIDLAQTTGGVAASLCPGATDFASVIEEILTAGAECP